MSVGPSNSFGNGAGTIDEKKPPPTSHRVSTVNVISLWSQRALSRRVVGIS